MPPHPRSARLPLRGAVAIVVWVVVVASAGLGIGCAGRNAPPPAESSAAPPAAPPAPAPAAVPAAGSTTDPFPPPPPPPDAPPAAGTVQNSEGWTTPSPAGQTPGYRVQIFASSERDRAEAAAAEARRRFTEPVYVEYEAPLYKVRVGDCATRHEADTLKEKAGTQGYDGAWVAETPVSSR